MSIAHVCLAIATFIELSLVSATCYFADGQVALNEFPCPNSSRCCPPGDTCLSNGLCQDVHNFNNASLATIGSVTVNFTGLYSSGTCIYNDTTLCPLSCTSRMFARQFLYASQILISHAFQLPRIMIHIFGRVITT